MPDKIVYAVTLLNNTKPHLASIKNKLGANNSYYLKISTQIVGNALHNIIGEVNDTQSILKIDKDKPNAASAALLGLTRVKSVLEEAWKATLIMDSFDMESEFKSNRYNVNRRTLEGLCDQLGVSTSSERVLRTNMFSRLSQITPPTPPPDFLAGIPENPPKTSKDDTSCGCIIGVILFIIFLIATCN